MKSNFRSGILAACLLVAAPLIVSCQTDRTAGQTVDDAAITASVKSRLLADDQVSGLNVNVTSYRGQVQLSGYVENTEQRQRAEQIAKNVEGVRNVSNDLIVKAAK